MTKYIIGNEKGCRVCIQFSRDNAAFEDGHTESARIVRNAMERNAEGERSGKLRDINGNTVGAFREIAG